MKGNPKYDAADATALSASGPVELGYDGYLRHCAAILVSSMLWWEVTEVEVKSL